MTDRAGSPVAGAAQLAERVQAGERADAAVDADGVHAGRRQRREGRGRGRAVGEHQVLAERHRRDHRHVGRAPAPRPRRAAGAGGRRRSRSRGGRRRPRAGRRSARGTTARIVASSGWRSSRVGGPSGPMLPPTHASRPLTSRASRATWAARRLRRPASAASPKPSSRIRLAPKVSVSMRSAPASRYSRWIVADEVRPRRGQLVQAGALRDAAREQERAHAAVGEERAVGEAGGEAGAGQAHDGAA